MGSLNLDHTFTNLLTGATFRVTNSPRLPFSQLAINWARNNLAISLLNFITFAIGTTVSLLGLNLTRTLGLARSTFLGALAPSSP
jgi:hypothetical protein